MAAMMPEIPVHPNPWQSFIPFVPITARQMHRTRGDCVGSCSVEIVDPDVQVQHHLLFARTSEPGRPDVGTLVRRRAH